MLQFLVIGQAISVYNLYRAQNLIGSLDQAAIMKRSSDCNQACDTRYTDISDASRLALLPPDTISTSWRRGFCGCRVSPLMKTVCLLRNTDC